MQVSRVLEKRKRKTVSYAPTLLQKIVFEFIDIF